MIVSGILSNLRLSAFVSAFICIPLLSGVVLAYSTIAAADLAAGRLVRLFSLSLPDLFSYYIATAPGALERPKVRAFRDWLREEADATPI